MRTRRLALATLATLAMAGALVGAVGAPAFAQNGPSRALYYYSKPACLAEEEQLVETHHRIYQGCTPDVYLNGKAYRWRLLVF